VKRHYQQHINYYQHWREMLIIVDTKAVYNRFTDHNSDYCGVIILNSTTLTRTTTEGAWIGINIKILTIA
jgi:hypothetical protein